MKNGFTLIELLTVIVILGVIAGIAVPTITKTIQNSRVDSCKEQVRTIERAAERWATENSSKLYDLRQGTVTSKTITVKDLQTGGYLSSKSEIINPVTSNKMTDVNITITYNSTNKHYSYSLPSDTCTVH